MRSERPIARLPEEWLAAVEAAGERPFRAEQIFRWIHQRGTTDPEAMTNLPKALRARLVDEGVSAPAEVEAVHRSTDGTRKLVLALSDGHRVECVIIPRTKDSARRYPEEAHEDRESRQRVTLCVSTQVGCAMGCVFCASGQAGLERALGADEVVFQVLASRRHLDGNETLSNLVFMGMGEPLHHYDVTARAIRLITHPMGLDMSPRRMTVSTVGLPQGIRRLGRDFRGRVGLAVSIHAPTDDVRDEIVPMNRRYPLADVLGALRDYPLPKRRRITIEYTLIANKNDSVAHASQLGRLLRGLPVKINLIPMNSIDASPLRAPSNRTADHFRDELVGAGYSVFLRQRRGADVAAACGQLALVQVRR